MVIEREFLFEPMRIISKAVEMNPKKSSEQTGTKLFLEKMVEDFIFEICL